MKQAKPLLERAKKHKTFGIGADYYLNRMAINEDPTTLSWLGISDNFCNMEESFKGLSVRKMRKLRKYDAARSNVSRTREGLQERIFERMSVQGRMEELVALDEKSDCWSEFRVDSLRKIIVNKTINPRVQVFNWEKDQLWEARKIKPIDEEEIRTEKGLSCKALSPLETFDITYTDASIIQKQYADKVLVSNYSSFWEIRKKIWDIYQLDQSYCRMDHFKEEYPNNPIVADCWYDDVQEVLCKDDLKELLAFHRNNPHTALDGEICNQILCIFFIEEENIEDLDDTEQEQIKDIQLMVDLQGQLLFCNAPIDSAKLVENIRYLAEKYQHHKTVFDLAQSALNFYATKSQFDLVQSTLDVFRPLFPDTMVCNPSFRFQIGKQKLFDLYEELIEQAKKEPIQPKPIAAWNTEQDEYGAVSWGETDEVFFMRRNNFKDVTRVMTSKLEKGEWTKPIPVKELSISRDVMPLSISNNGRMMLLESGGSLYQSYRPDIGRKWMQPQRMRTPSHFAGNAWIMPDDSTMLMAYYTAVTTVEDYPLIDLAYAKLTSTDEYGDVIPLGTPLNSLDAAEGKPVVALGGRLLFYTSDHVDGLGERDMYSASMSKPLDWNTADEPKNIGLPINTIFEDYGISYFSEYTGTGYFHRFDQCTNNMDIWAVQLGSEIFPENAMRLAGLVIDENNQPIAGGFMEFTADYQLNVHDEPISTKGTYTYTVADSTEVVRLFPEIPGYYSEYDATHFLQTIKKGEIVRDTFRLLSFDYIRRNFKLKNSTFLNKRAEFSQPNRTYPELTRLAKIATRMGAKLELSGHTDNVGSAEQNKQLSLERAQAVKQFLVDKCGFDATLIQVDGFGDKRPICDNNTEEGRRCNRRVQVTFKMPELPNQ